MFGGIKHFYLINLMNNNGIPATLEPTEGVVSLGWNEIGDLQDFLKNGSIERDKVSTALVQRSLVNDPRIAGRRAGEFKAFYEAAPNDVFVVMNNGRIAGFLDELSPYYFDGDVNTGHGRTGTWHSNNGTGNGMIAIDGASSTCNLIKKEVDLLAVYRMYYADIFEGETYNQDADAGIADRVLRFATGIPSIYPRNRILFGAPGTGKSFTLNREKDDLLGDSGEYERITFHPDYSYANFVGTYKPVPQQDAITYAYVPGPFMRTYVKALKSGATSSPHPVLLIIEEINRANVAAVFGDVFQLLDRGDDDSSEYPIQASEDMKKYLSSELGGEPCEYNEIRIPDNMFIWATMNSADQGVFPMDTAFKRRWDFTYLGIDDSEEGISGKKVILGQGEYRRVVEWNALRKAINNELLTYKVNEDKLMGPYFISKKNLPEGDAIDPAVFTRVFKNKVIMYLFDDAAKQKRLSLFGGCDERSKSQYSKICREFDTKGVYIFCEAISSQFIDNVPEDDDE